MAQTILYYPTIDIQDGQWLRNAILYWDSISSIVPYDNYEDLSPDIRYLEGCGIYEPRSPHHVFDSEYSDDFKKTIMQRLTRTQTFRTTNRIYAPQPEERKRWTQVATPSFSNLIHHRKIHADLFDRLIDEGYLRIHGYDNWLEVDSAFAAIYMRTLAEYVVKASNEDIVVGTDKSKHQNDLYQRWGRGRNSACLSLKLNACLPQPSMNIGLEELLAFKDRRQHEFLSFRKTVRDFEEKLAHCESELDIKVCTERFKETMECEILGAQQLFKDSKLTYRMGNLLTLIDVPIVALGLQEFFETVHPNIQSLAVLGGCGLFSIAAHHVNYRNKVNAQRSSAGFSYIMSAQRAGVIGRNQF